MLLTLVAIGLLERSTADCAKNNTENHKIKLNAQEGHLSNPGYPEYFPDNIQCTWFISVARRHAIELEFEFFDIGNHTSCSERDEGSFLEIHDGPDRESRSLGLFCGKTKPERIVSSGRKMLVRFNAKGCGTSTKFKANYRAVKDSPSTLLLITGVSTIVGLMVILLLLTLYLKRKRRDSDDESASSGSQNQENQQNRACVVFGTSEIKEENTDIPFPPSGGYTETRQRSTYDENNALSLARSQNQQNCVAHGTSRVLRENTDFQVYSVAESTETCEQSVRDQQQVNYCQTKERKFSQSLGAFARNKLVPVVE